MIMNIDTIICSFSSLVIEDFGEIRFLRVWFNRIRDFAASIQDIVFFSIKVSFYSRVNFPLQLLFCNLAVIPQSPRMSPNRRTTFEYLNYQGKILLMVVIRQALGLVCIWFSSWFSFCYLQHQYRWNFSGIKYYHTSSGSFISKDLDSGLNVPFLEIRLTSGI